MKIHPLQLRAGHVLILVFVIVAAAAIGGGIAYYRNYEERFTVEVQQRLAAIAELKVGELAQWRTERRGDAEMFRGNAAFAALVERAIQSQDDPQPRAQLLDWLEQVREGYQYDRVSLLDAQGVELLSAPPGAEPMSASVLQQFPQAMARSAVTFVDFYRSDHDGHIYLTLLAPVADAAGERILGVVALRIDPTMYLYPFIQRWPAADQTAETLLVRREGDDVLFLNDLKFQADAALSLRVSLSDLALPAARAVMGEEGPVTGLDYRGVPVIAEVRPIPGSPWFLVARMDTAEVYAPLRARLRQVIALVGVLILGAGAGVTALWRQQEAQHYLRQLESEQALRDSERRFSTLFESMAEGVVLHEVVHEANGGAVDYRILDTNPAFEMHTDMAREMMVGRLGSDVYGVSPAPYLQEYAAVADTGHPFVFETFFAPMARHFRVSAVSPARGRFATVFEDITERKQQEDELRARTAEMERFTYTVSHDLKSPLVTIKTFLGYLTHDQARQDAARVEQDLGYIRGAVDKMGQLLDELLDLSRVGRIRTATGRASAQALAQEALDLLAGPIRDHHVAVQVQDMPMVLTGERPRLLEIWQNLIENAVKFMGDQAEPRIEIGVQQTAEAAVFYVRDNGLGIDPRYQEKVFGLFEKLDPTSQGTGMGLALVRRIVEHYNGRIWVESQGAGRGSTFYFTLPVALCD